MLNQKKVEIFSRKFRKSLAKQFLEVANIEYIMPIIRKDDFCFFDETTHLENALTLIVDNRYDLIEKYIIDNKITSISINLNFTLCLEYGLSKDNLLKRFPSEAFFSRISGLIKYLYIGDFRLSDIKGIQYLQNLETLSVGYSENTKTSEDADIDFSKFPKLKYLYTPWFSKGFELTCNKELESLIIYGFAPKSKNFISLQLPQSLKCLELVRANIVDFDGLKMSSGEKIECYYCKNLESLKGIDDVSATLKRLMIENSKKLLDYDPISKCTELNSLVFSKCGDMSSLSLLSSLSKLTHFCMLETTVKDGDISQLLSIEKVAITNKQHYNYKLTLSNKWIKR